MGISYEQCDHHMRELGASIIAKYHGDIETASVTITYLFARAPKNEQGEPMGPAVKVGGYPCAAKIKLVPLVQRADGRADVEVIIDADQWDDMTDPQREALLAHELYHLELCKDEEDNILGDDIGRPRLKLKKHDHQFGWFNAIAERYADESGEVRQAKAFVDECGQSWFGWARPPEGGVESMPAKMPANITKAMLDATARLTDGLGKDGSVTMSATSATGEPIGKPVTLTAETGKKCRDMIRKMDAKHADQVRITQLDLPESTVDWLKSRELTTVGEIVEATDGNIDKLADMGNPDARLTKRAVAEVGAAIYG